MIFQSYIHSSMDFSDYHLCIVLLTLTVQGSAALDCYSCSSSPESACTNTVSCGASQVCSNAVFRRYALGVIHTKGCKDRGFCSSLQDLNEDRYCSTVPSECTYCCETNYCNTAERPARLPSWNLSLSIVIMLFWKL